MATYKGKITNRSWQHLPSELVRLVVTHALLDISATAFLPRTWEGREQWMQRMAFNVVRDTDTIEQFMSVCPSWAAAIESHLFWQQAAAVLDPHDMMLHYSRTPVRLSPYNHFRYNILNRCCVPCRINQPLLSVGLCQAKRHVYTLSLGNVPCCREHRKERFCGICLRDAADESVVENEDGDSWPQIDATCRNCRAEWLWRACDAQRTRDAIGGKGFGAADWETRQAVDTFVELGEGTIREVVALALEKHWLRKNTKIADMLSHAVAASRFQTREAGVGFESEDEEEEEEEPSDEEDADLMSMTEDAGGVRDLAINDWARSRILDGHWFSPADQWHLLQAHGANRAEGVVSAVHPCPWNLSPDDLAASERAQHPSPAMARSEVPPSYSLCEAAFEAFRRQMRAVLLPAMSNLVRKIVIECAADGLDPCIRAARMDVEDVAAELRDDGVWYNGMDWLLRRANSVREREEKARVARAREARERQEVEDTSSERQERKDDADDSSSSSKSDGSHTTSPVLSTSTLQTTPSPPPIMKKVESEQATPLFSTLTLPIAISPVLESPTLIPSIPYVPVTMAHLPPFTIETFKAVWREACAPLYQCRCSICERAVMIANIEAGNIVPTQVQVPSVYTRPLAPVQVHLEEEVSVVLPTVVPSVNYAQEPLRSADRKRSLQELDVDGDMDVVEEIPSIRAGTPPKRARTDSRHEHESGVLESPGSANRLQKRRSEELDDAEDAYTAEKKRARKERERLFSPPLSMATSISTSPSDEGDFQLHYPKSPVASMTPKSVFPLAAFPGICSSESVSEEEELYVLDETTSDLDAEGDILEVAGDR